MGAYLAQMSQKETCMVKGKVDERGHGGCNGHNDDPGLPLAEM